MVLAFSRCPSKGLSNLKPSKTTASNGTTREAHADDSNNMRHARHQGTTARTHPTVGAPAPHRPSRTLPTPFSKPQPSSACRAKQAKNHPKFELGSHAILHMRKQVRLAKGLAKCLAEGEAEGSHLNKPPFGLSSDHMPYSICANRSKAQV
jgi:hypothetical protein